MKKVRPIHLVLLAGLIHGLLYVFIVPPWQHYDEPGHFEVAWLIANHPGLPSPHEYDQGMRRELAASMAEHGFFKDLSISPDLVSQTQPVWIGISQADNPPLYYWFAALPLRLVPTSDIAFQLILCRLVSLLFYLLTILAAYALVAELTPPDSSLRWLIPAVLVVLPGFTELMTAVNNDVGAAAFFSLFLWMGVRTIQRGFSILRLLAAVLLAAACYWTKNTAAVALPLLALVILFSLLRERKAWLAWTILGAAIPISFFLVFSSGDVASWYQLAPQSSPTRAGSQQTPLGAYVFQIDASVGTQVTSLAQPLSSSQVSRLRGKLVTLGYWIWADQEIKSLSPTLKDDRSEHAVLVEVTQKPTFHTFTAKIAGNTQHLQVVIASPSQKGVRLYLDGLVLAKGDFTQNGKPALNTASGASGIWGGKAFTNPIRNASAEQSWPRPRGPVQRLLNQISPIQPNMILASLADWGNSRWYYRTTLKQLFRTFWGQFGWGQILLPRNTYLFLAMLTALGLFGGAAALVRCRKAIPWGAFTLLAFSTVWIWGVALVRGVHSIAWTVFIPSARYAYPAIVPTMLALWLGWSEWLRWPETRLHLPPWARWIVFLVIFLVLDAISIWTITRFYGKL